MKQQEENIFYILENIFPNMKQQEENKGTHANLNERNIKRV